MTSRTPQCEVFWAFLLTSEHSGVPKDSKSPTFPSVGLHPHTWPKWGCDKVHHFELSVLIDFGIDLNWNVFENMVINTTLKSNINVQDH
jgi:hypothetical protein